MRRPVLRASETSATYAMAATPQPEQKAPAAKRARMMVGTVVLTRNASWAHPYRNMESARVGTRPMRSEMTPQNGENANRPNAMAAKAAPKIQSGRPREM